MPRTNLLSLVPCLYYPASWDEIADIRRRGSIRSPGFHDTIVDENDTESWRRFVFLWFRAVKPPIPGAGRRLKDFDYIWLKISPSVMEVEGVRYSLNVFKHEDWGTLPIGDAEFQLDFEVLYSRTNWRDRAVQHRLSQAERQALLVPEKIPSDFILNLDES